MKLLASIFITIGLMTSPALSDIKKPSEVTEVTNATFAKEVLVDKPVFLLVYTNWCPSCAAVKPAFYELSTELSDKVKFLQMDLDKNTMKNVRYIPTFFVIKNGSPVKVESNAMSKTQMKEFLTPYLGE